MYERNKIVLEQLTLKMLESTQSDTAPSLAVIAGQPGSFRYRLIRMACAGYFKDRRPAIIGEEPFLHAHPLASEAFRKTDRQLTRSLARDARIWTKHVLEAAVAHRRNVILIETLRSHEWIAGALRQIREKGYAVHILAMATPKQISLSNLLIRHETSSGKTGIALPIILDMHDESYSAITHVVRHLEAGGSTDSITVCDRQGKSIYSITRNTSKTGKPHDNAFTAIQNERAKPLPPDLIETYTGAAREVLKSMRKRNAPQIKIIKAESILALLIKSGIANQ